MASNITTYIDIDNSVLELFEFNGFETGWGAGPNVCFRCGDGIELTKVNGQWGREFSELRIVSLPSSMTYEIIRFTSEEYDLPRNTGLKIGAVFVNAYGDEDFIADVTDLVLIDKINASVIGSSGIEASWTWHNITRSVVIPISVVEVDIASVQRNIVDLYCSYNTTEFIAEERIETFNGINGVADGDYCFYDVKIYKEDLNPVVSYHVQHANGVETDVNLTMFERDASSLVSTGPHIEGLFNEDDFIISTLRDYRLNDDNLGFGFLAATGSKILTGPQLNGSSTNISCDAQGDFIGDVLADRYLSQTGWGTTRFGTCSKGNLQGCENDVQLDFDTIQTQGSEWLRETEDLSLIYLRLDWRRRDFCKLTVVDDGVLNQSYRSATTICVSNNPLNEPRLKIWMPFKLNTYQGNLGYALGIDFCYSESSPGANAHRCFGSPWASSDDWPTNLNKAEEYHISPFIGTNVERYYGPSIRWPYDLYGVTLASSSQIKLFYFNAYFKCNLRLVVNYTRRSRTSWKYNCDRPKYDILPSFSTITGEAFWKSLQYATNYFTNSMAREVVVIDGTETRVHPSVGYWSVDVHGYVKVYMLVESSIFGKKCVYAMFNKMLGPAWRWPSSLSSSSETLGAPLEGMSHHPTTFSPELRNFYFNSNGGLVRGDSPVTTGAEEIYQLCEG